jgi:hypothetical protein
MSFKNAFLALLVFIALSINTQARPSSTYGYSKLIIGTWEIGKSIYMFKGNGYFIRHTGSIDSFSIGKGTWKIIGNNLYLHESKVPEEILSINFVSTEKMIWMTLTKNYEVERINFTELCPELKSFFGNN